MSRDVRSDQGAVAVVVALCMVAMLMFGAIVIDVGYWYDVRRQLQAAADAGALAGCQEYINTRGDFAAAQTLATQYALLNDDRPADGMLPPVVDYVAPDIIRVTTAKPVPRWLAGIFGSGAKTIHAVAEAQAQALTGAMNLVPWALPIVDTVDHVEIAICDAALNPLPGMTYQWTTPVAGDEQLFSGSIPAPTTPGRYTIRTRVWNTNGIWEAIRESQANKEVPAVGFTVAASSTVTSVRLSSGFVNIEAPEPVVVTVKTAAPVAGQMRLKVDRTAVTMIADAARTTFTYTITAADLGTATDLLGSVPLDVGADGSVDAYVTRRRTTHVVQNVEFGAPSGEMLVAPGATVPLSIRIHEYVAHVNDGTVYTMRVAGGTGDVGNYCELNFGSIIHLPDCPPDTADVPGGTNYREYTANGFPGGVHIGDVITTSPGNSGANTRMALDERFAGLPAAAHIVIVPIVEKVQDKGGSYDVVVVNFAAFQVLSYDNHGTVSGVFLKYAPTPQQFGGGVGQFGQLAPRLIMPTP